MADKNVKNTIPVKFSNYQSISDTVSKVKVYVMYAGVNRNGSYISKEAVERALPSLYGCPVVGEYKTQVENFGDHGGRVIIDSDGIKFEVTTKPYGFVALDEEHANFAWEEVEDEDGNKKNYLVCDAYLWRKRYPELDVTFEQGSWQSMELDVIDYEWREDDYVELKEFKFDGLCILGKSDDSDVNVEPCFEQAKVVAYSLNKDEFKSEFSLMMKEIKDELGFSVVEEPVVEQTAEPTTEPIEEPIVDEPIVEPIESVEVAVEPSIDYEVEYALLSERIVALQEELETVKGELNEYKLKEQEFAKQQDELNKDDLFEQYDDKFVENENYEEIKKKRDEYSSETLKTALALLYVESNVQFSAKTKKQQPIKVGIESTESKPKADPYGGLFMKN